MTTTLCFLVNILFDKTVNCKTCTIEFPKSIQNDNWSVIHKINERKSHQQKHGYISSVCLFFSFFLKHSHCQCHIHPIFVYFSFSSSVLLSQKKCKSWKAKNNKEGTSGSVMKSCVDDEWPRETGGRKRVKRRVNEGEDSDEHRSQFLALSLEQRKQGDRAIGQNTTLWLSQKGQTQSLHL